MKEMKTASTQGLLCRLKKALKGLESQCERRAALRRLKHYIALLENVQQMPFRLRLKYWACTTVVYFYLQMNKQLGRTVGPFSDSVRETVKEAFQTIIGKYDEH